MQLASDYYERGFLHNIKYLESIAERYNILINTNTIRIKGEQQICGNQLGKEAAANSASSSNSRTLSAQSSTSTATTLNEEKFVAAATDLCCDDYGCFSSDLKRRQSITTTTDKTYVESVQINSSQRSAWHAIRVQIKPIAKYNYFRTNNNQFQFNNQYNKINNEKFNNKISHSMNDYLNANYMHHSNLSNIQPQQQITQHYYQEKKVEEEDHYHYQQQQQINYNNNNNNNSALALLADLANLEIKSESDLHLPKITLTDCCTHNTVVEEAADTSEQKREISAFILKQSKFNLNHYNSLELPGEQDYHSEARPP